jgi:hypothetical protein
MKSVAQPRATAAAGIEQAIEATQDANRLQQWLRGVVTANDLDSIGIAPPP